MVSWKAAKWHCKGGDGMGILRDFINFRKFKYAPLYISRGEYQANGSLYDSDIVGAIANCIGTNAGKLKPQLVRTDWQNLNGRFEYAITGLDENFPEKSSI